MTSSYPNSSDACNSFIPPSFNVNKVEIISDRPDCATFVFTDEDHTIGNSLHYILMKNPQVDFSGYSIPHPSDNRMNLRIQTKSNITSQEALLNGLNDLKNISNHILETFNQTEK
ncbi:putative RNA polymerase III subunit [Tieghemostelium lacteum]|uniref:DNA-directed RNA polymerases I and III subunit RPAC2 n=1 Tax=Tieghemostelium lacteum TaxID=361077 RepID=A0A151Z946_TIELA|nr:putative RNA polymerase III subunit [Tieghemostelium lacteum]|eukprot:KYQ90467.1 putative RNA polymerase III subunit [Tieghemostelium lacteum]